jgi:hypothetical protein
MGRKSVAELFIPTSSSSLASRSDWYRRHARGTRGHQRQRFVVTLLIRSSVLPLVVMPLQRLTPNRLLALSADKASVGAKAGAIEAHPERRFKAALEKYIEDELPVIRKEVRLAYVFIFPSLLLICVTHHTYAIRHSSLSTSLPLPSQTATRSSTPAVQGEALHPIQEASRQPIQPGPFLPLSALCIISINHPRPSFCTGPLSLSLTFFSPLSLALVLLRPFPRFALFPLFVSRF